MISDSQQLLRALTQLAQNITNTDEEHPFLLAKQLLLNVNPHGFHPILDRFGYRNFHSVQQVLQTYYYKIRGQKIKWDCELLGAFQNQFVQIAVFVFDLALTTNKKETYIQGILALPQQLQRVLQPFVQKVTLREQFTQAVVQQQQTQNRQKWIELTEQYQKVRQEKEQWLRKYEQLKQSYDYLKTNHDKIAQELSYLRQQRYSFINELGGNECDSVQQTIEKVKLELYHYEKNVQKIQKQLQQKKIALKKKEQELNQLVQVYKANNFQPQSKQLQTARKRLAQLDQQLNANRSKQHQLCCQLQNCKQYIRNKEEYCQRLQRSVASLQAYGTKYQTIRKLHNHFKSKIVKQMKELNQ